MAHFVGKNSFVNNCPVLLVWTQTVVYIITKFYSGFATFQTCWEKPIFWVFLSLFLRYSIFWHKREVNSEFFRKFVKTTEKYSLAVCGSFWGEIFFVNICTIWLDWKKIVVYIVSKFSSGFATFQTSWEKIIFWIYQSLFWDSQYFYLRKDNIWNHRNLYKYL